MSRLGRSMRAAVLALGLAVSVSACDFSVYDLPLPGGPDVGDDPLEVTVKFVDVLDLVPHSTVKVNDVNVGKVTDVQLDGYVAEVTLQLRRDVVLPDNVRAELRQTSLLGEKFVSLEPPAEGATGELESGDVIPLERSGRNPEVEEVLGALSLILNGGGVAQLQTITSELNEALEGREGAARSVLRQVSSFMEQLDDNKADIVDAIESLNRLAISVRKEQPTIDAALEELPSALDSIDRQRADLVKMLEALDQLSDVGVDVISRSKDATVESLRQLQPVLTQFAASGENFAHAFHVFLTYPFVDEVVGRDPQVARNLHMGDYTNLSVHLDVDLSQSGPPTLPTNLPTVVDPTVVVDKVLRCLASGDLNSAACREVLANLRQLTRLREVCREEANRDKDVCKQLNLVPGLPPAGPVPSTFPTSLPSIPLPTLLGLGRAAPDQRPAQQRRGPTVGELMETFDSTLVRLLVPGLVAGERER